MYVCCSELWDVEGSRDALCRRVVPTPENKCKDVLSVIQLLFQICGWFCTLY